MASDNVDITEGSGKTVATDEIQVDGSHAQGQVQFIKLVDGTLNGTGSMRVNQAAKANALTVAPASDISDATYIGDIKFGEPIVAGTNLIGKVGIDQTTPGTTNRVDIGALIPGTGATNLGKARDSALGATDTGVMALVVRDDTLTTLTPADGDYVPLRVGSTGKLHVTDANITACNTGAVVISSGTVTTVSTVTAVTSLDKSVYVDDADWTDNTSSHTLVGGVYQSSPHTVTDGDVSPFGVDVNGNIVLGTSAKAIGKLAANTGVDIGDVDVTSIVPGVGATNLGKAEDAAHSSGDVGVMMLAVREDVPVAIGANNDYMPLIVDAHGRLYVTSSISTSEAITDWTAIGQNAIDESGTIDCSEHDGTSLLIQAFLTSTSANTGVEFRVQVSSNTTGNEDWHDYRVFNALTGTATLDLIEDNPLTAGSTSLTLTGHALTEEGIWLAIVDGTLINSELIYVASQSANAVVALDGTTNSHIQNTAVYNIVMSKVVILDATVQRARVIVNNTKDDDGGGLAYKVRVTKLRKDDTV